MFYVCASSASTEENLGKQTKNRDVAARREQAAAEGEDVEEEIDCHFEALKTEIGVVQLTAVDIDELQTLEMLVDFWGLQPLDTAASLLQNGMLTLFFFFLLPFLLTFCIHWHIHKTLNTHTHTHTHTKYTHTHNTLSKPPRGLQ